MRRASAFLLALAAILEAGVSEASGDPEPIPLRVELTAPPGCPDASDLRREMERRGTATRSPGAAEKAGSLRVEIVANDSAAGVVAHLTWTDDQDKTAERRLEAPDCAAAINALALIAALALVRGAATASPAPPAKAPPKEATAPGERLPPRPMPASDDRGPAFSLSATAAAFVSLGSAPEAAFGVLALAGVAVARRAPWGPFVVRAGIDAAPARSYAVGNATASFGMASAAGEVCPLALHLGPRALVSPCVLGEFGVESASGPGGENALTRPWAAAGLEARLSVPLVGPVFFDMSIDGMAPIDRNRFHVGDTLVYEAPPAVGRVALGLGWMIP